MKVTARWYSYYVPSIRRTQDIIELDSEYYILVESLVINSIMEEYATENVISHPDLYKPYTLTRILHSGDKDSIAQFVTTHEPNWEIPFINLSCQCGSDKTYGTNTAHSSWCPKYKPNK